MQREFNFIGKLTAFAVIFSILLPVMAQTRRTPAKTPGATRQSVPTSQTRPTCAGGWNGIVTYKKILKDSLESDEPGIRKAKDRIKHKTSRNYEYTGRALVDGTNPQATVVNTRINLTDDDKNWGEERVWDSCGSREEGHWFVIESNDDRYTEAKTTGAATAFNLNVNEMNGNYSFSLAFPEVQGTYKRQETVKRTGFCQPKNNEPSNRTTNEPTRVESERFEMPDGKIDPDNPDRLSGTRIWGDDGTGSVRTFVYQVSWTFTRCPEKLLVTDVRFEHPKFPKWDDWQEISEQAGTIDGNLVKIKAKVANLSTETKFAEVMFKETYKGDKWDGARPDYPLKDSSVSIRLEAGEEREVEVLWDSQGFAWFDDGRPRLLQRVKVEAWEDYKLKDQMTKNLKISPKPLVIVPGVWTNRNLVALYQNLLTTSHSYGWRAQVFGNTLPIEKGGGKSEGGGGNLPIGGKSVYDNADDLAQYVKSVQTSNNAWHVDMLAHSNGGIVARLYVHKTMEVMPDNYPGVKHLMLLGVPNKGVPCASSLDMIEGLPNKERLAKELTPEEMALFNQYVTARKGTKFSALVGNSMPVLCTSPEWNDGFVSVESAKFGIADFAITKNMHPDLLNQDNFSNFVKPHLVTGPRSTYPLPVKSEAGGNDARTAGVN